MLNSRGIGALGKVLKTSQALAHAQRFGLTVRAKSTGNRDRPPLTLIKSFLKLRKMEASHIRPVPDHLESRIKSESKPTFLPHRCVLDDRNYWTDFRQQKDKNAEQRKKKRRQWRGSLFQNEEITDLEP